MKIESYAKINLGLKVVGKRQDGFHDIISLFLEVDLADELTILNRSDGEIRVLCSDPRIPDGGDNLVFHAADALRRAANDESLGCEIEIQKRIPSGGGLGGGSSNAAAAISRLNEIWNTRLGHDGLRRVSESVGSDVPFFLTGGCASVSGRGEIVQPIDFSGNPAIVLVDPGFCVPTAWAFGKLNIELTTECPYIRLMNSVRDSGNVDLHALFRFVDNDFLTLVAARYLSVHRILSLIRDSGAECASMSGTGATLYGGFADETLAREAIDRLRNQGYIAHLCRPVRRLRHSLAQ